MDASIQGVAGVVAEIAVPGHDIPAQLSPMAD